MSERNSDEKVYSQWQHEREMTRLEIQCKRWFIAFLVVLVMLFGSNLAWVIYENQFQDVVVTSDVMTGLGSAVVNNAGIGDVSYGQSQNND